MPCVIGIADWGKHYENNKTRELKRVKWVSLHNKLDDEGYTTLVDHPSGAAHFGVWCAILEVASRGKTKGEIQDGEKKYDASPFPHGRGLLLRENGEPHDEKTLSRLIRMPSALIEEVLPRLKAIGWVKTIETADEVPTPSADDRHHTADEVPTRCRRGADGTADEVPPGRDGIGEDGKGEKSAPPPTSTPPKKGAPIDDLRAINPSLTLSSAENSRLEELNAREPWPVIVEAYREHQRKKPGKAFRWFLDDFAQYKRIPKPPTQYSDPPPNPPLTEEQLLNGARWKKKTGKELTPQEQALLDGAVEGESMEDLF